MTTSKGFYIALCSVIAVVGFSLYSRHLKNQIAERSVAFEDAAWREAAFETEAEVINVDEVAAKAAEEKADSTTETIKSFEKVPEVVETVAAAEAKTEKAKLVMEMPCKGNVIGECSIDELVYSETMKDWRTHNGIDIAAKVGEQVKAAESGIVSKVYKDDLYGVVVTIDHGDEVSSVYANLQNVDFIKVGTKVQKGDIIGGVGECGALEKNLEPHLHFEVKTKGDYKNPKEFLQN